MGGGLKIRKDAQLDFLSWSAGHRTGSGDHSFPQGDGVQDSRQRRRVQCGCQPFGFVFGLKTGNLRRPCPTIRIGDLDCRTRPRDGREAVL